MIRQVDWGEVPRGTATPRLREGPLRPAGPYPEDFAIRAADLAKRLQQVVAPGRSSRPGEAAG